MHLHMDSSARLSELAKTKKIKTKQTTTKKKHEVRGLGMLQATGDMREAGGRRGDYIQYLIVIVHIHETLFNWVLSKR